MRDTTIAHGTGGTNVEGELLHLTFKVTGEESGVGVIRNLHGDFIEKGKFKRLLNEEL